MPTVNKRKVGELYEQAAANYLIFQGLTILDRNFRTRRGEIDLVAKDDNTIVFVEVKYRSSDKYGDALEAVNLKKQIQIRKVAIEYLNKKISRRVSARFDVIGITGNKLTWIKNAF